MKWSGLKDSTTYLKTTVFMEYEECFFSHMYCYFLPLWSVVGLVWASAIRLPELVLALSFTNWVTFSNQWNPHASVSSLVKMGYYYWELNKLIHVKHLE